jgi:hypothetical protein
MTNLLVLVMWSSMRSYLPLRHVVFFDFPPRKKYMPLNHGKTSFHREIAEINRRSADELKKVAQDVVEFVRSKGKAGVTPGEIKAAFGNLFPSPAQFVKKYGGARLHQKGPVKRPRYFGS